MTQWWLKIVSSTDAAKFDIDVNKAFIDLHNKKYKIEEIRLRIEPDAQYLYIFYSEGE